MKYFYQFLIILSFTFLGELLNWLIPLPIPAAVYGLLLLFLALQLKIVKPEQLQPCGNLLPGIMGFLFVAPSVNLLGSWDRIAPNMVAIAITVVVSTIVVFGVSGIVTQLLTRKKEKADE